MVLPRLKPPSGLDSRRRVVLRSAVVSFRALAKARGPFQSWHSCRDPYRIVLAEVLLRRTTRIAAERALSVLIANSDNWQELATSEVTEIAHWIRPAGLAQQRASQLRRLAETILHTHCGHVPRSREQLLRLPGVGEYVADALRLYLFAERVLPLDANAQRVLRRILGLPVPRGTKHLDFDRDSWLQWAVRELCAEHTGEELREIHRGILLLAWHHCGPTPSCLRCAARNSCDSTLAETKRVGIGPTFDGRPSH